MNVTESLYFETVERRERLWELLVFLFLIVPSMVLSFFAVRQGGLSFNLVAYSTIVRDLALVSLVAFFLWRNGEPMSRIGWTFKSAWREAAIGILLFPLVTFVTGLLDRALQLAGLSKPSTPLPEFLTALDASQFQLAIVMVLVVAVAEETLFRGYLIRRFEDVTGSVGASVLLSSLVFALGHGYEGAAGVVAVGFMGACFALVYLWRRSLVAPIVMHFLQDFLSIVVIPILARRH